jgi:uncharacterized protein YjeT (DUF2065 family)
MTGIVAILGLVIVLLGLTGLVQPARFRKLFTAMDSRTRFVLAIVVRLAMGALLWVLADELRHPQVMRVLAVIAVVAAVALLIMGRGRLDSLIGWWLAQSDSVLRVSASFAAAFGAYLVFVAI